MTDIDKGEQDDFLVAAALFRFGPWALMAAGLLLSAAMLAASLWRIEVGRRGEYDKAFDLAAVTATAMQATLSQLFVLLQHNTHALQAAGRLADPSVQLRGRFAVATGIRDPRIRAFIVDDKGRAVAGAAAVPADAAAVRAIVQALPAAPLQAPLVMPEMTIAASGETIIPVVYPLALPGASAVVYMVDAEDLAQVFAAVLNGRAGWLQLSRRDGTPLAEVDRLAGRADAGAARAAPARSTAEAMAAPVERGLNRLLLSRQTTAGESLVVTVGLGEADMLRDMRQRVQATWLIFGLSVFVVMSLVTVTSIALRKFAIKERYLRRLATIDILTGLPNRRSFQHLLKRSVAQSLRRNQTLALMFVDLDNFKDINDSLGHEAGDQVLRRVARLLQQAVRQGDRVCRLGGDEFTVLLANLHDEDEARRIGQRVLELLTPAHRIDGLEVHTHATIGIALMPQHATNQSDLMRFADTAMYRAKHDGKRLCLVYDESMQAQALFKAQRVRELNYAIAHDELFLEYQPKFCLQTSRVTGYEALVRWRHPQQGLIGPGHFIALAEEAGLIIELGQWVLERAVRQLRDWHAAGIGWQHLAINVSALQLRNGRFAARVQQALDKLAVPGSSLQLEFTESSLVIDSQQAQDLVAQVRAIGVSVAVDDFGTGYSSLAALQQFSIDVLKIDRAFVNVIESRRGEEICRAVISLARGLHMRSVAEGVETAAQRDVLERLGCDEVQGYLYARPMPAEAVLRNATQPLVEASGLAG